MNTTQRGFTLVELLTVIAVIGILSSVTIFSLSGARERARDGERVSEIGTIVLAAELYKDACGRYPADITDLAEDTGCPSGVEWEDFIGATIPTPPTTTNYGYSSLDGSEFVVYDDMETNAPALSDDITGTFQGVNCADPRYCSGS